MPPKNKKQAEQQARRLEQQRKKRQEEEALLELQRKKYAGETLQTGLFLPASNQLIIDFSSKEISFISDKLLQTIKANYENLTDESFIKEQLIKELHYYIKDSRKIFKIEKVKEAEGNENVLLKARVFIGIFLNVMLNDSPFNGGQGKVRQNDQKQMKKLLASHSTRKGQQTQKVYESKSEIQDILKYAARTYFAHFSLLKNYKSFDKRTDRREYTIHMNVPAVYTNNKQTPWTDLSKKEEPEQPKKEESQEKKQEEVAA